MEKPKPGLKIILPFVLLIASLFTLPTSMAFLRESPFSARRVWDAPSYVSAIPGGGMIVVDKSKTRVNILDEDQLLTASVYGGVTTENGFYYAEYTATDGESVYVADVTHMSNSNRVERERILRYSMGGKYLETIWDRHYEVDDMPLQLGTVRGLSAKNGKVYFPRLRGSGFSLCTVDEDGKFSSRPIGTVGERVCYAAHDPVTGTTAFSTMQGSLLIERKGELDRYRYGNGVNVIQGVALDEDGRVYAADLSTKAVVCAWKDGYKTLYAGDWIQFVSTCGGYIGFHDDERVCLCMTDGGVVYDSVETKLSPLYFARVILAWITAAYLAFCLGILVIYIIYIAGASGTALRARRTAAIIVLVLLTAFAVGGYVISYFNRELADSSMDELKRSALYLSSISSKTYGDAFARLGKLSDYDNVDYREVRRFLDSFCLKSFETGLNTYYILLKYNADADELWGVMDYENTNGVVYPYQPYTGSGYDTVAKTGVPLVVREERNAFGLWSYVVAPVFDGGGRTVGLLELGANTYSQQEARRELVFRVIWTTFSAMMMALLMYNELVDYFKQRSLRREAARSGSALPALGFVRIIIFLAFLGDNLDAAFIPQLSERLFVRGASVMHSTFASALPMSAQLFAIALASLFSGPFIDRHGVKKLMLSGGVLRILSAVLTVISLSHRSFAAFTLAKLIGGLGSGALIVGCNTMPSCTEDENERTRLFAGLNIGVMEGVVLGAAIGGYIAQYLGRVACYICVAAIAALCLAACAVYIGKDIKSAAGPEKNSRTGLFGFIKKPSVFGFLLFILFPFMVMGYFKDYMFPLFASSLGHGEADIGNVLLIGGILAIYLGEILPGHMLKRFGARACISMANLIYIGAILLFVTQRSFVSAVAAICVLSLGSFGMTAQGVYISDLAERENMPAGTAIGLYSFTDNMGQTCGPLILGALLPLGFGAAMGAAAGGGFALLSLFYFLTRKDGK